MALVLEHLPSLVSLSPLSERDAVDRLVARLRASDVALHERVLRELLPDVRRWTTALVGRHPEAEDAVQESLAQIATALYRFEGRSSLRTLARRITVRAATRHMKRHRAGSHALMDVEAAGSSSQSPEQLSADRRTLARIHEHLAHLVPNRRVAFVLCVIEGLTPSEAAAEAGCTAIAMRGRLFQARRELEERLRADERLASLLEDA